MLVDISINNEAGGGAKISVARRAPANSHKWHLYPSIKEAEKILIAFGIRGKLVEGLDHPLHVLLQLGSREPIDFLSVEVPEDVLVAHGFKV